MVNVLTGWNIGTKDPVDPRFTKTKAEMLATIEAVTPSPYPCWCPDDGKMYIFDKNNEDNETTGKYKEFSGGSDVEPETEIIDFSKWPDYVAQSPEITDAEVDGEKLVVGDDSNLTIDPSDIEDDD